MMMSAQLITWVCGLAVFISVPRFLGSQAYGRVFLALSFQMMLGSFVDYGGNSLITKDISRDRSRSSETMSDAVSLRIVLWIVSIVIALLACGVAGYSWQEILLILILVVANLWVDMTHMMRYCFLGFEDIKYPSIGAVAERGFLALTVIPALFLGARELVVVLLIAASGLVSFSISAKYSRSMFRIKLSFQLKKIWRLLQTGLPYFLWAIFGIIYFRIDAVLLSLMAPDSVVGWYGGAYRLFDIVMFLPSIFAQALYPIISRLSKSEGSAMIRTTQRSLEFLLLVSIPLATGLLFFSRPIIGLLLGLKEFAPSAVILQIFSVGTVLVYLDFALGNAVQAVDKQKQWAVVGFAAMILNIVLNVVLIKHFQAQSGNGGIGAAIATDVTEFFVMLSAVYILPKGLFGKRLAGVFTKAAVSGAVMALMIIGGENLGVPWIALGGIGVSVYAGMLFVLNTFDERELQLIAKVASVKRLRQVMTGRNETSA